MAPEQLYISSIQSGLVGMRLDEFCGSAVSCCGAREIPSPPQPYGPCTGLGRRLKRGGLGRSAPRNPIRARNGLHLDTQLCRSHQLTDELVALGPLGGSSLQLQVTADNNQNTTWLSSEYELVVVVMASGIFGHERDTSSTFLGLNKTRNMLCDNSPTVVTRSAEWSAAASGAISAPGRVRSR